MIQYTESLENITVEQLEGFFVGWIAPPTPERHLQMLQGSVALVLAIESASNQVVGFVNAIGDGFHAAFIPNLEVLPAYQGKGIGTELMHRIVDQLQNYYSIDLVCDPELETYYAKLGMIPLVGMSMRNHHQL